MTKDRLLGLGSWGGGNKDSGQNFEKFNCREARVY